VYGAGVRGQRPFGRRDYLLTLTLEGAGVFRLGGAAWETGPGEIVLLEPGTPHDYGTAAAASRWGLYWAHFTPSPGWADWLGWPELARGLRRVRLDRHRLERACSAFRRLLGDLGGAPSVRSPGGVQHRLALNSIEELVLLASEGAREQFPPPRLDPRVRDVLDCMQRDLSAPQTLERLAARAAVSPSRLRHLFKSQVGLSPRRALTWLRLMEAARLLEVSDRDLLSVAMAVGFADVAQFSRRFRAEFGQSPRAYRQHCRSRRLTQPALAGLAGERAAAQAPVAPAVPGPAARPAAAPGGSARIPVGEATGVGAAAGSALAPAPTPAPPRGDPGCG
jgi:AraC family transcriptional regulator of arabinose operon